MIDPRGVCVLALVALVVGCGGHSPSKPHTAVGAATEAPTTSETYMLATARAEHESILLPTGEIFVVGGVDSQGEVLASTEIVSETGVRPGPTLSMPRTGHTLTLLPDGLILIAGGVSSLEEASPTATTQMFDPEFGDLREGPDMADARAYHTTFFAGDALVAAGGQGEAGLLDTMERIDILNRTTEILPVFLNAPQRDLVGVAISPLQFVFVGGQTATGPTSPEIFDGTALIPLPAPGRTGAAIVTNNGSVVLLSGESEGVVRDDLEVFDGFAFQPQAFDLHPRTNAVAAVAVAGIVVTGGVDNLGASGLVEIVLPTQVAQISSLTVARHAHTFTLGSERQLGFVIGGYDDVRVPTTSIELIRIPSLDDAGLMSGPLTGGPLTGTAPRSVLQSVVDAKTLGGLLRAASGADCNTKAHKPATSTPAPAGSETARLSAAATARLVLLIADAPEPTQAELLALPAQPKPEELIGRLEKALTAMGVTNASALATETRAQLTGLCAVKFPGSSLTSFLKHYANKSHPAKSLLIARVRLFKGLEAAAMAPAIDTILGAAVDANLKSFDEGGMTAAETLPKVRAAFQAIAADLKDTRAANAFTVLGQLLESDAISAPTAAPAAFQAP